MWSCHQRARTGTAQQARLARRRTTCTPSQLRRAVAHRARYTSAHPTPPPPQVLELEGPLAEPREFIHSFVVEDLAHEGLRRATGPGRKLLGQDPPRLQA